MAIHRRSYYEPECDTPDCDHYRQQCLIWDWVPYYETPDEALKDLLEAEWTQEGDALYCGHCSRLRQCDRDGHLWGGSADTHLSVLVAQEWCQRCTRSRLFAVAECA